jgi:hypothetical protein
LNWVTTSETGACADLFPKLRNFFRFSGYGGIYSKSGGARGSDCSGLRPYVGREIGTEEVAAVVGFSSPWPATEKRCNQLCNPLKLLQSGKRWPIIKAAGIKAQ